MKSSIVKSESIPRLIHRIRGVDVILDEDIARLYGVPTGALNQAVKRNRPRFPADFMFVLSRSEWEALCGGILKSHIVISSSHGGRRKLPSAFTEQGVSMLSSVLRSPRAIEVNIAIVRVVVRLRAMFAEHKELAAKVEQLERKMGSHDQAISVIFDELKRLLASPQTPKRIAGFSKE